MHSNKAAAPKKIFFDFKNFLVPRKKLLLPSYLFRSSIASHFRVGSRYHRVSHRTSPLVRKVSHRT